MDFTIDKTFYDIEANDLKELWDSDLDPTLADNIFRTDSDDEWGCVSVKVPEPHVILHDRLMTDAALGTVPIKTEHSYCSPNTVEPSLSKLKHDDLEEDCYPAIPLNIATGRRSSRDHPLSTDPPLIVIKDEVKDEPLTDPDSPMSSCPPSPRTLSPPPPHSTAQSTRHCRDMLMSDSQCTQNLLKQSGLLFSTRNTLITSQNQRVLNIKIEPNNTGFALPPTPPSSASSDSEGNVSPNHPSSSPASLRHNSFLQTGSVVSRQPIQTALISSQPKGSTGVLYLTEEEKRTLLAEGYPIPTRLPFTKAEEKALKKIRRKIKNKISAQESRRKKKEYMDALEKKVDILKSENSDYKKRISNLEDTNYSLVGQLKKLQAIIARHTSQLSNVS
uniref:Cyclic AMP response element-binding protein A n=1 Tax=Cacopsylla melanoneura TaxID=428564 RepID=A0A8D8WXW0_9HEMI